MAELNKGQFIAVALMAAASSCSFCGCSLLSSGSSSGPANSLASWSVPWLGPNGQLQRRRARARTSREVESVQCELDAESRANVLVSWGLALEDSGQLERATEAFEQAVKAAPKWRRALLALARNYARVGRPEAALTIYRRAAKFYSHDAGVYNDLGLHLAEMRRWDQAIEALEKATELDPFTSKYHNNLGLVLAMSGRFDEALSEFKSAVGPAKAYCNLARVRLHLGDRAGARDDLQRALALMPELEEAKQLLAELEAQMAKDQERLLSEEQRAKQPPAEEQAVWPASHTPRLDSGQIRLAADEQQVAPKKRATSHGPATLGRPIPLEQGAANVQKTRTAQSENPWSQPFIQLDWLE